LLDRDDVPLAKSFCQLVEIRALHGPGGESRVLDHFVDRPMRQQLAVGNKRKPMAALGFVHIVSRDQKG